MNENFENDLIGALRCLAIILGIAYFGFLLFSKVGKLEESTADAAVSSPFVLEEVYVCDFTTDRRYMVMRDSVTDVLYLQYRDYRKGGLTVMLNPTTGLPLTYTDYLAFSAEE